MFVPEITEFGAKWYKTVDESCFRSAGALTVFHMDQTTVDMDKLVRCLQKAKNAKKKVKQGDNFNFVKFFF